MRHLTILVDMDDTIENLAEAWVDYLNARHQTSTSLSDITDAEEVLHIQLKSYQRLALRLKGGLNRIENHSVFNRLSQV